MSDRHPDGYIRLPRAPIGYRDPGERVRDYETIYRETWDVESLPRQGERCMDCGVPTCMSGCPLGNLIPDWNHLVSRRHWREALVRLHATNNFPEFTGYTCPAPCESACTLAVSDDPVAIKSIERAIVDMGWAEGWIVPEPPAQRTPYQVAIVGSGPAGMAAAQQLNRVGHRVTVFERDDAVGGLMTYGIPDFKFAKRQVRRRVDQLAAEGINFRTNVNVGIDVPLEKLRDAFDAVCLAIGGQELRDLDVPGRELEGVMLGLPYLIGANRRQAGRSVLRRDAQGAGVVVLGGGDTGADCVATAIREGAASVTQVDINTERPSIRPGDNPWPEPPVSFERTYAQEEGSEDVYGFDARGFRSDGRGRVSAVYGDNVAWRYSSRRLRLERILVETEIAIPADLVLIAVGFTGAEATPFTSDGLALDARGTVAVNAGMETNIPGLFAAGDANMGQSLVVWAIGEGRDVARAIDLYLMGDSSLPASLRTRNVPIPWDMASV